MLSVVLSKCEWAGELEVVRVRNGMFGVSVERLDPQSEPGVVVVPPECSTVAPMPREKRAGRIRTIERLRGERLSVSELDANHVALVDRSALRSLGAGVRAVPFSIALAGLTQIVGNGEPVLIDCEAGGRRVEITASAGRFDFGVARRRLPLGCTRGREVGSLPDVTVPWPVDWPVAAVVATGAALAFRAPGTLPDLGSKRRRVSATGDRPARALNAAILVASVAFVAFEWMGRREVRELEAEVDARRHELERARILGGVR